MGYRVGDLIHLVTGVIVDSNGHPVPDETPVEFLLSYSGESIPLAVEASTLDGVATASLTLDRLGVLTIQARSDPARASDIIQLDVQEDVPAFVTLIVPTAMATATRPPTATSRAPTPTPGEEPPEETQTEVLPREVTGVDLVMGLLGVGMVAAAGYATSLRRGEMACSRMRYVLVAVVSGLAGYNYLSIGLPGSGALIESMGVMAGLVMALAGGVLGLLGTYAWCSTRRD
jgi:hypothetical protein